MWPSYGRGGGADDLALRRRSFVPPAGPEQPGRFPQRDFRPEVTRVVGLGQAFRLGGPAIRSMEQKIMKRKLKLSRETVRELRAGQIDGAVGGSRVRCGPGTYADSCFNATCGATCVQCPSMPCPSQGNYGETCATCPIGPQEQ